MNNADIERLALENGFKLKAQFNGDMALNPYVFDFAHALIEGLAASNLEMKSTLIKQGAAILKEKYTVSEFDEDCADRMILIAIRMKDAALAKAK